MKPRMGWTAAAAIALAMTATSSWACDQHAQAADAKAVAANGEAKGCDKPCCATKTADDAKNAVAPAAALAAVNTDDGKKCDKPCDAGKTADGKGCPKKGAMVAKAEPAKDAPKADPAEPAPNAGANR
jgi:hypothetical protein